MRLPNAHQARVEDSKLRNYLLSPEHPIGRHKYRFFKLLGYSQDQSEILRQDLLSLASSGLTVRQHTGSFGQKFEVHGKIKGPNGRSARLITIWIVEQGQSFPRLVTAYPRA